MQSPLQLRARFVQVPSSSSARRASSSTNASATAGASPGISVPPFADAVVASTATRPNTRINGPTFVSTVCTRACGTTCQRRHSQPRAT